MQNSVEVSAPTVEEAIQRGLELLDIAPDQVEIEVLDSGSKGFLGFGSRQVRVRLKRLTAPSEPLAASREAPAAPSPQPVAEVPLPDLTASPTESLLAVRTRQVLQEILRLLRIENPQIEIRSVEEQHGHHIVQAEIHGQGLDILIGRRAETLQALQYLVSLIVGKEIQDWVHVVLDVEGYRQRREQQLRRLAARMAEHVVRTGRRQVLEPMPAAERRIIHLALRDHPDVTTQSIGEEPNRKVVIIPRR